MKRRTAEGVRTKLSPWIASFIYSVTPQSWLSCCDLIGSSAFFVGAFVGHMRSVRNPKRDVHIDISTY